MLDAGASLVQLYTGFIYRGPALVRAAARARRDPTGSDARPAPERRRAVTPRRSAPRPGARLAPVRADAGRRRRTWCDSAEGVRLRLADGRELVDGMSSWWAAIHGYRHPVLDAAVTDQLGRMSHVMFGGLTHEPAVRLAKTLVELTPDGLEHVFLADSGSVSVEVAVKMCLQYQRAVGRPQRPGWRPGGAATTATRSTR